MTVTAPFEPRVLALLCDHCAYAAADRAGAAHLECPPEVRVVRVPCSGRVGAEHVLHALARGADGVVVIGCHPGDCRTGEQNVRALQRRGLLARALEGAGVAPARFALSFVSADEPERLARELGDAVEAVRALGPLRIARGLEDDDEDRDGAPRRVEAGVPRMATSHPGAQDARGPGAEPTERPPRTTPMIAPPDAEPRPPDLGLAPARVAAVIAMGEAATGVRMRLAPATATSAEGAAIRIDGGVRAVLVALGDADEERRAAALHLVAAAIEAEARAARPPDADALLAQALVDSVSGPLCWKDVTGRYVGCNAAFQALVGRTRDEILERSARDLFPPGVAALDELRDDEVRRFDGVRISEESIVDAEGERRDFVVDRAVYLTPRCEVAGTVTAMTDITERRRAERVVAESQQRLLRIVENTPLAVIEWDAELRVMVWNAAAERIFGWKEADVIGVRAADLLVLAGARAGLDAMFGDAVALRDGGRSTHTNRTRAGREIRCEWHNVPLVDEHGVTVGIVSIVEDVTDRIAAEAAFEVQAEKLRQAQKMEAVGRLAGGVAHDFNNILLAINTTATLALDDLAEDAPLRADFATILAAGERGASLTQQLLAFSRKQVMNPTVVDLNRVVEDLRILVTRLLGAHVAVRTSLADDLWPTCVDRVQIDQVLLNLAVNARDAMPNGGQLSIATTNHRLTQPYRGGGVDLPVGDYVVLEVCDTGHGMTDAVRERIFEPFFTTKPPGQGTGLGLATVLGIVEQSGGHLEVRTAPSRGATFRIYLPRASAEATTTPRAPERDPRARPGEVVLLVEDDPAVRQITRGILARAGYQVHVAHDAEAALALLRLPDQRFDAVVTDVIMPGRSGADLVRETRALRPGLPCLFMSGYAGELLKQAGVVDSAPILYKPFSPRQLTSRVRDLLDARRAPLPEPDGDPA